ncbi:MAG: hypothetical protein AAF600_00625 [Bacteroidota bacterium]
MKTYKCVSGKRIYETVEIAEEALIQHHIVNEYKTGEGPINVYKCHDCGNWHFTSKGEPNSIFDNKEMILRIKNERRANYWERHLK